MNRAAAAFLRGFGLASFLLSIWVLGGAPMSFFNRKKPEVIVSGAGPVGLFAALSLARRGVRVEIIEEEWRGTTRSYALALHPGTLELLDQVGLAADVLERARRLETVAFYDGATRQGAVNLSELKTKYPFVAVLPQVDLEELLIDALAKEHVQVQWSHRLASIESNGGYAEATIDTLEKEALGYAIAQTEVLVSGSKTVRPPFLLAADGHESLTRTQLGIRFDNVRPSERFAVFEFDADGDLPEEVSVVLEPKTTSVLWPMPKGRYRWSFQIDSPEFHRDSRHKDRLMLETGVEYPEQNEALLQALIERHAPWFEGEIGTLRWSTVVDFDYCLARAFGKGRVWLAGDAGHMTGPVGAQSMNVGMREAAELAEIFSAILQNTSALSALEEWNERRITEWRKLLGADGSEPKPAADAEPWLREHAGRLPRCLPASGAHLGQLVGQLGLVHG